jgi:hypothetical protein
LPGLGSERFQLVMHASAEALAGAADSKDVEVNPLDVVRIENVSDDLGVAAGWFSENTTRDTMAGGCRRPRGTCPRSEGPPRRRRHRRRSEVTGPSGRRRSPDLDARRHHIWHWGCGGPTCIGNLISLCDSHHWLVHEGGWHIAPDTSNGWLFRTPDGRTIRTTPEPAGQVEPLPYNETINADAVTGKLQGSSFNLNTAIEWLNTANSRN